MIQQANRLFSEPNPDVLRQAPHDSFSENAPAEVHEGRIETVARMDDRLE